MVDNTLGKPTQISDAHKGWKNMAAEWCDYGTMTLPTA